MFHNEFLSEIFKNLDVDSQMLISFGKYEPSCRPKNAISSCVINLYFSPFFIDHPVNRILSGICLIGWFLMRLAFDESDPCLAVAAVL